MRSQENQSEEQKKTSKARFEIDKKKIKDY